MAALVEVRTGEGEGLLETRVVQLFSVRAGVSREQWTFAEDQYALDEAFGRTAVTLPDAAPPLPRARLDLDGLRQTDTNRV